MTSRDRLHRDDAQGAIRDGPRCYMTIRPEALMGAFRRLAPDARDAALKALGAAVFEVGSDSARADAAMGGGGPALARTVAETAPMLGWGRWAMTVGPAALRLTLAGSPFADGFGPADAPVCHAIAGMLRGLANLVLGRPAAVRETACAACGAPRCTFEAVTA